MGETLSGQRWTTASGRHQGMPVTDLLTSRLSHLLPVLRLLLDGRIVAERHPAKQFASFQALLVHDGDEKRHVGHLEQRHLERERLEPRRSVRVLFERGLGAAELLTGLREEQKLHAHIRRAGRGPAAQCRRPQHLNRESPGGAVVREAEQQLRYPLARWDHIGRPIVLASGRGAPVTAATAARRAPSQRA